MKGVSILCTKSLAFCIEDRMADPEGRFIFLKGTWKGRPVTLANIYYPNSKQVTFLKDIILKLTTFQTGLLILGGGTSTWP